MTIQYYRGHKIEIKMEGSGWNVNVFDKDGNLVCDAVGYDHYVNAASDAMYAVDQLLNPDEGS